MTVGGLAENPADPGAVELRWMLWFHELDAWTEYWDIYHPETKGRYYFGNGQDEPGLLTCLLPNEQRPPAFAAWTSWALSADDNPAPFAEVVRLPSVSAAVMEVDGLVGGLFARHFGDPADPAVQSDYLEAMFRCGTDTLPPATERGAKIAEDDWRKRTAGRHMIDGDLMWFAWSLQLEAAHLIAGRDGDHPRRALQLAGVATGCPANFAWRGHRRTRPEYLPNHETAQLLRQRGLHWATDFTAASQEVHALFRLREWGHE